MISSGCVASNVEVRATNSARGKARNRIDRFLDYGIGEVVAANITDSMKNNGTHNAELLLEQRRQSKAANHVPS